MDGPKSGPKTRGYSDLHDHIRAHEAAGLLMRVDRQINKDTELHPLVRWQFRGGFRPEERKAWLFTNVIDAKGQRYGMPVLVGATGSSARIYEIGLGMSLAESHEAWTRAIAAPIPPRIVTAAACQDIVIEGDALDVPFAGLDGLPVPISTPGWANAPYLTGIGFITKDPDSGISRCCHRPCRQARWCAARDRRAAHRQRGSRPPGLRSAGSGAVGLRRR